jgi:hypothetical protein
VGVPVLTAAMIVTVLMLTRAGFRPNPGSFAVAWGSVVWAQQECPHLKVTAGTVYSKLKSAGMRDEHFFSNGMEESTIAIMLTLNKNKLASCALVLEQYGPQGRTLPGLIESSR